MKSECFKNIMTINLGKNTNMEHFGTLGLGESDRIQIVQTVVRLWGSHLVKGVSATKNTVCLS